MEGSYMCCCFEASHVIDLMMSNEDSLFDFPLFRMTTPIVDKRHFFVWRVQSVSQN